MMVTSGEDLSSVKDTRSYKLDDDNVLNKSLNFFNSSKWKSNKNRCHQKHNPQPPTSTRAAKIKYTGLNGPRYTLNNGREEYRLPETNILSSIDGLVGTLSLWPAHCNAGAPTNSENNNKEGNISVKHHGKYIVYY